ncbi:hypothetical protein L207DRAFT_320396 [Hyaloscypha variabilis F]|uniref:Uncharacterized protein n=1 Tax=Hyaloscypha variabilis (strain UAMH 11265 / GT02V1 / F) TaxID=1149755 RepID=A0A2J6RWJ4_HYAVF|nr:hypothetical protein L207DRAFT_320396 [Hyaloscypha variabilis F]
MCWTQNVRSAWYRLADCRQPHVLLKSGGELYVQLPDDNSETFTGSIFEPISLRPPARGRRYVYIWHCCSCRKTGISILSEACPDCGVSRCANCQIEKVRV